MARSDIAVLWSKDNAWLIKEIPGGHRWWDCGRVSFVHAMRFVRANGIEFHLLQTYQGVPIDTENLDVN